MSAATAVAYEPEEVHPPGDHLHRWLDFNGMSQAELARRIGLSTKHVNQLVNAGVSLTPEVAVALEKVTSLPATFWARLEANYRSAEARREDDETLSEQVSVLERFPIREMERRGYFDVVEPARVGKLRQLLKFFGVANVSAFESVVLAPAALRASKSFKPSDGALAAWLRRAELLAGEVKTKPFDQDRCTEALQELRSLTTVDGIKWLAPMRELCADVGIAVVIERELPGCRINGATRWITPGRAMVALSLRHRRHDIFWFTFFHELGHLLRHSKRETFVDAVGTGVPEDLERDADRFASRLLIPVEHERELHELSDEADVIAFAKKVGVGPGIVVGRMHHEKLVPANRWQRLIPKYKFTDD